MRNKKAKSKIDNEVLKICTSSALLNENVSVILFTNEENKQTISDRLNKTGCKVKYVYEFIDAIAVEAKANLISKLANDEAISYIAKDNKTKTCMDIASKAVGANESSYKGDQIGVAVIDTGIYPHSDLTAKKSRIIEFVDFVGGKKKPYDDNGHGTHCAGIIAGDGFSSGGKYTGIAPKANLIGLKVMDSYGAGSASDILAAMQWVYNNAERYNIRVVSMSLGASGSAKKTYDPLVIASEKLWDKGIVVVAAAGNEGPTPSTINSPGVCKKIITVGASDDHGTPSLSDDTIAEFSSRGPSPYTKAKPDLIAPGVNITSLLNSQSGYTELSGTSMATPIVSGLCALIIERYPEISPDEVKKMLKDSAYSLKAPATSQGKGIVSTPKELKTALFKGLLAAGDLDELKRPDVQKHKIRHKNKQKIVKFGN